MTSRRTLAACALVGLLLCTTDEARADSRDERSKVLLVTVGPGEAPFLRYGHSALLFRPERARHGTFASFGAVDIHRPLLALDVASGKATHTTTLEPETDALDAYRAERRRVETDELALTPEQFSLLASRVRRAAASDSYGYDILEDNCTTRLRDAIDATLGGRLHDALAGKPAGTYREHLLEHAAAAPLEHLALHFLLGRDADAPIDEWQAAFLPSRLQDALTRTRLPDGTGPLARSHRVEVDPGVPPTTRRAIARTPHALILGTIVGAALAALGHASRSRARARTFLRAATFGLGLLAGLAGCLLVALWIFGVQRAMHQNVNILFCGPWSLALCVAARAPSIRRETVIASMGSAIVALSRLVGWALPGHSQDNALFAALFIPLWIGLAVGLLLARRASVARLSTVRACTYGSGTCPTPRPRSA